MGNCRTSTHWFPDKNKELPSSLSIGFWARTKRRRFLLIDFKTWGLPL